MTLKEFLENIADILEKHPDALDLEVITSIDDEGNGFDEVLYSPSLGYYEDHDFDMISKNYNAICIN